MVVVEATDKSSDSDRCLLGLYRMEPVLLARFGMERLNDPSGRTKSDRFDLLLFRATARASGPLLFRFTPLSGPLLFRLTPRDGPLLFLFTPLCGPLRIRCGRTVRLEGGDAASEGDARDCFVFFTSIGLSGARAEPDITNKCFVLLLVQSKQ